MQISDMTPHNHSCRQTTAPGGMERFELQVEAFDTAAKATTRLANAADFAIIN